MSFFENFQNLSIEGGTFNAIGRDQINVDQSVHATHYHYASAIQEDEAHHATAPAEAPKVFDVPNPSTLFQGRRTELEKLKDHFKPRVVGEPRNRRSLLVHGMGGIGKTQLCLKFSEETANQFGYIFWIDASTPETTSLGLKDIPEAKSADSEGSVKSILRWISRLSEDWLLVFDNAEEHIHKFIPPGNLGNILMTSRNWSVGRSTSFKVFEIEQMDEDDAVYLLLKASCLDQAFLSDALLSTASAIVKELYCLPLAVDQAGHSIASGLCEIDDYLQQYFSCRKDLLDDPSFRKASFYEQTVYGTWELSYREIEAISVSQESPGLKFSPEAAQTAIAILETFAFLHHDNIKQDIFRQAAMNIGTKEAHSRTAVSIADHTLLCQNKDGEWDKLHFQSGIRVLLSFSLIKQGLSNNIYTVHPLVHAWSQDQISSAVQQVKWKEAKTLLAVSISRTFKSEDYRFCQHLIPHIRANFQLAVQADIEEIYDDLDCMAFGLAFGANGDWKKTEELYIQALNIRKDILGLEHPDTLVSMSNLTFTYRNQGRWKEAEELQVQACNISKKMLGPEHPDTLTNMTNLAFTYRKQGRLKEAEELQVQNWNISKRVLEPEHPHTLISLSNLASIYSNQGRWKEAEELQVQAWDISKRVLGPEHPDALASMGNLASTYGDQGRMKETEELQVQAWDISKRVLGLEHPDTLASMSNLASTYMDQGKLKEAEELQVQCWDISKRVLGSEHPDTVTRMSNLAVTYWDQGRMKEAEELQVQAWDIYKRVLGSKHPDTVTNMSNLASTYWNQGRWKEAEELLTEALHLSRYVLGENHPDTQSRMTHLASFKDKMQMAEV